MSVDRESLGVGREDPCPYACDNGLLWDPRGDGNVVSCPHLSVGEPPKPTDGPDYHAELAYWRERVLRV